MPAKPLRLACCALSAVFATTTLSATDAPAAVATRLAKAGFSAMAAGQVAAPWRVVGLPGQKIPLTRFDIHDDGGRSVLRVQADGSYGNLVFDADGMRPEPDTLLRWSWRMERALAASDLRRKDGDDAAIKVCALFDMPLDGMSLGERSRLRFARAMSGEALPAATLCYVWDRLLPEGTELPNVYSPRVRYLVATHGDRSDRWIRLERRLGADFLRAFGHETKLIPPLIALVVGADADNTGSSSLAFVGDLALLPANP